jgi:hypothetical protein
MVSLRALLPIRRASTPMMPQRTQTNWLIAQQWD